jgi:predicted AlkP superfamily pyrophosphatase or phosphodiesterase
MEAAYGEVWTPLVPPHLRRFVDDGAGEGRPGTWGRTFPHPIVSTKRTTDNEFVSAWERSPLNDAFLTDLAIYLLQARKLGTGAGTDLLALSLPVLDHIGHEFGPRSHEVQDVLFRIDIQIGRLIDALDAQVGRANYVLAFTSDHGVADMPEQRVAEKADAGRISGTAVRNAVNAALERVFGAPGRYAASVFDQQIALTPGVMDRLRLEPGGLDAVKQAARTIPGIAGVLSADDLIADPGSADPSVAAWQLSYVPGRSGDFMIDVRPGWILRSTSGTTHGSAHAYDRRVPLMFFGGAVRAGVFATPATPADLAPTLASLVGIALPRAQGRALGDVTRK